MQQHMFDQLVRRHFPRALDAKFTAIEYLGKLRSDYQIDISKVLLATSLCSDEINAPSVTFYNIMFGPFVMGGLSGFPFAGITGMSAFASHIPDGGCGFIFYGPHIGITRDGELGKMCRPRQVDAGASCGALMLALDRFRDPEYRPILDEADYQQGRLELSLLPHRGEILNAADPVKAITEAAYREIDRQVRINLAGAKNAFKVEKVALLGGIIINTDHGLDDYVAVRSFEVVNPADL